MEQKRHIRLRIPMHNIPLTKLQKEIMREFYAVPATRVVYRKAARNKLWEKATARALGLDFDQLNKTCPALGHQIRRSYSTGYNIQSAVFSECVYAQTFADMFDLNLFANCMEDGYDFIPNSVRSLLQSYSLLPRYVYSTSDKRRMLIQAGGCDGIDSALITVIDLVIYTIEFKEPGAKTSEPDLPKYGEDGNLVISNTWLEKNPQFSQMIKEASELNFFDIMGSNYHNFSVESIEHAVSTNYASRKKYADVVCTEDKNGYLVMLPTNQLSLWAEIEGEIRPAGRNHYKVWTPNALRRFLHQKNATIRGNNVSVSKEYLAERRERGGNRRVSGFKITPLFFIYTEDCVENAGTITFDIEKIRQLNPTIAGKMFFKKLKYNDVKQHYEF